MKLTPVFATLLWSAVLVPTPAAAGPGHDPVVLADYTDGRNACVAYLGAGIVRGSIPEAELRELDLKAEALFASFAASKNEATA